MEPCGYWVSVEAFQGRGCLGVVSQQGRRCTSLYFDGGGNGGSTHCLGHEYVCLGLQHAHTCTFVLLDVYQGTLGP